MSIFLKNVVITFLHQLALIKLYFDSIHLQHFSKLLQLFYYLEEEQDCEFSRSDTNFISFNHHITTSLH